jgi:CheY-like chemotaxis protein
VRTTVPLRILLVEDSLPDIALTKELMSDLDWPVSLDVVRDGERALRFLRRTGEYIGASRPDLVLLDLNLPTLGGLEVLRELRADQDDELRVLPVLILTTSRSPGDVDAAYRNSANAYVAKPIDPDQFGEVLFAIGAFWLGAAHLPGQRRR